MLSEDLFADPPAEFRPMPFWFWHTKLDEIELLGQVREMHEKGCGGFFIHARFGLETEYLGDEWFRLIARVCEEAKALGMEVWLYDEESFPSGLAGGRITDNRAWRSKFVDLTERRVIGPAQVRMTLPRSESDAAYAIPTAMLPQWPQRRVDLGAHVADGELRWDAPEGDWTVMVLSRCTLDSEYIVFGVDYTDADAMAAFFEMTFEPYVRRLSEYFGDPIKGMFTDEPTLLPWHHDSSWYQEREHRRVAFWSPAVEQRLASDGVDPQEVLAALFYDVGAQTGELRRAYWEAAAAAYEATFFQPYREWCDEHGLEFTGHLLLEEGLYNNSLFQADPSRTLRHMHRPGADHLGVGAEHPYGGGHLHVVPTNLQGLKLVPSVAHISGRNRVLTESFGCGGWAMTIENMKRIVDWQWALGINFLCPHAVFGSIEGFRKTDAPPCPMHNTMWQHYRALTDYVGRLSYLLCQGSPAPQIALVYPLESFQQAYAIGEDGGRARAISDTFDHLCVALMRLHYDYDIVPRWALETADVEDGKLRVGDLCYEAVIWPFAQAGDELRAQLGEQTCVLDVDESVGAEPASVIDCLGELLHSRVPPWADVRVNGSVHGGIYALHRRLDDGDLVYLANVEGRSVEAEVDLPGGGSWDLWDCETGEVCAVESEETDGRSRISLQFDECRTWVVARGAGSANSPRREGPRPGGTPPRTIELPDKWEFRLLAENARPIDEMRMRHVSAGMGQEWRYEASFVARHVPPDLALVFDDIEYRQAAMRGLDLTVRVNDCEWRPPPFESFRWPEFKALSIAEATRRGDNSVEIVIRHQPWQDEPKVLTCAPRLMGGFALLDDALHEAPTEAGIGSWTDMGLPFYSGPAEYSCRFAMPDGWEDGEVVLEVEDLAEILEVFVNDTPAGTRWWRPWRVGIGHLLKPGENTLRLRITNTIANLLDSEPVASGLLGRARIVL